MYIGIDPLSRGCNDRLDSRSHSQIEFFNGLLGSDRASCCYGVNLSSR